MPDRPSLGELLLRWQENRQPPEELCKDCPELLDPLRQNIEALGSMESFLDAGESRTSSADLSEPGPLPTPQHFIPDDPGNPNSVAGLMARWRELRAQGQDISAEELCRACPHLLDEVKLHIANTRDYTIDYRLGKGPASTPPADEAPPPTLGRYQLETRIGRGGFGEVWRGFDPKLKRTVAIKRPRPDRLLSPQHVKLFLTEAQKVASLRHAGIVPVHDVGQEGEGWFIVSEFIDGDSLAGHIASARPTVEDSVRIVAEVADALHYAHLQGLVHRDIKPGNILLDQKHRAHLTDFGLAVSEDEQLEERASITGTPAYMAPEQIRGESNRVDARTDIYSMGVVLYELLTGRLPFKAATITDYRDQILHREPRPPRTIDDTLPKDLEQIVLKCLAKPMAERYTTAKDLAEDLRNWQRHQPSTEVEMPAAKPQRPVQRWHGQWLALATVVAMVAGLTLVGVYWRRGDEPAPPPQGGGPVPALEAPPQPGVWQDLLAREPVRLLQPTKVFLSHFDPEKKLLWWDTKGACLFRLGATQRNEFEFEATFDQSHLAGQRGLFLGYPAESADDLQRCHALLVGPDPLKKSRRLLIRAILFVDGNKKRVQDIMSLEPFASPTHLSESRFTLAVSIKQGKLDWVKVDGKLVEGLTFDPPPKQPVQFLGTFGVFVDSGSGRLTAARWKTF